ncbi:helix-hairpin-helix domain-containing protein [Paraflavisolibacter sp. H34]|uniref:ComEA family DNA-binding protein n=1 Tax=Huijunlia imazamoxiresistens TaxID=3127457 RepID=UPI00301B3944
MGWQNVKDDYLRFSRKDRIGLLCFFLLLLTIYLLPVLFSSPPEAVRLATDTALLSAFDTLERREAEDKENPFYKRNGTPGDFSRKSAPAARTGFVKGERFVFDPNTLPEEGWMKLGLNARTSRTIVRYRQKGGRFRRPEDLKKIYSLPEGFYEYVKEYMNIAAAPSPSSAPSYSREERPKRTLAVLNINTADTTAFIALPGIGSRLAARIVNFREKLGGFHSVRQLGETYGLPDSTFQQLQPYFTVSAHDVRKININTAGKDELKAHPYIQWHLANAIVEYQLQHGPYQSVEELKKIHLLDATTMEKIRPYVTVELHPVSP